MNFCSEVVEASSRPSRIIHKPVQSLRDLIPAPQITRFHQGYQVISNHLRLLDLQREALASNALVEQLVKGPRLRINELGVIRPMNGSSSTHVNRFLEDIPMTEGYHRGDDRNGAERSSKENELRGNHRDDQPQDHDSERERESATIEVESVGHNRDGVSEN
jgi:hypothetical protein